MRVIRFRNLSVPAVLVVLGLLLSACCGQSSSSDEGLSYSKSQKAQIAALVRPVAEDLVAKTLATGNPYIHSSDTDFAVMTGRYTDDLLDYLVVISVHKTSDTPDPKQVEFVSLSYKTRDPNAPDRSADRQQVIIHAPNSQYQYWRIESKYNVKDNSYSDDPRNMDNSPSYNSDYGASKADTKRALKSTQTIIDDIKMNFEPRLFP